MKLTRPVILAAVTAAMLAGCGGGSHTVTIHGMVQPASNVSSVFGVTANSYATCSLASPSPGDQVTVTDPSGKVIGTASLGAWSHAHFNVAGVTAYLCDEPFTFKGVARESRYGFKINGVPGTIWESNVRKPVSLKVSSG